MLRFLAQRIPMLIPVVLLVFTMVFAIMHIIPGDPVQLMLAGAESGAASPEQIARLRTSLGLDQPLYHQYLDYLWHAVQGNLGTSIRFESPVTPIVVAAAKHTFLLSIAGLVIALMMGLPLGVVAAWHENSWIDTVCMVASLFAVAMPLFWLGQLLIMLVSIKLEWLPAISGVQPRGIILPAFTLGAVSAGLISRLMRSSLIEALHEDYIRTARAKGLSERRVITRHAVKAALIPVVTVVGLQFGAMLAGAVITETVFSRPGLGTLVVNAIVWKDYPLVQGTVLFIAISYVLVNVLVDAMYTWIDPRIHYAS